MLFKKRIIATDEHPGTVVPPYRAGGLKMLVFKNTKKGMVGVISEYQWKSVAN